MSASVMIHVRDIVLVCAVLGALGPWACGGDSPTGVGGDDADVAPFVDVVDTSGVDIPAFDATDTPPDDGSGDAGPGDGCDSVADCATGEVCVDLLPGPANGFCTTRCVDDTQCPEGYDCVVVGDDEASFYACVDVDFCLDADEDGFGVGPGCIGADCDDTVASINPAAEEVCNGTDDDCDELVDDNPIEAGDDCGTGFAGVCGEGRLVCAGGIVECVARYESSAEICDGRDNDCDGEVDEEPTDAVTWYRDIDGDRFGDAANTVVACTRPSGYIADAGDCDDRDATVSPAATEICDGWDNNCDGVIDGEGAAGTQAFYADTDGDGFGDPETVRVACPAAGWVANDRDCNDGDSAINPDADEVCDTIDNDCDGTIDEGGGLGADRWYADADEDGFGDLDDVVTSCRPVDGRVRNDDDCNDRNAAINPDGVEVCDTVDNDCDGVVDDGVATEFYRDADGDTYGNPDVTRFACTRPDGWVTNARDCDDSTALRYPGRTEVCDSIDNDCNGVVDDGAGTTWYIDNDGDGYGQTAIVACVPPDKTVREGGDCNDANPGVNPDANELCATAYDDDCDGSVNEQGAADAPIWYLDSDGDGQGAYAPYIEGFPWTPWAVPACTRPPNFFFIIPYVQDSRDCDDSTRLARVGGGPEECDGYDNDCNGLRDDGYATPYTYCRDSDGDGNGDPSYQITVCRAPIEDPDGWVATTTCTDFDD